MSRSYPLGVDILELKKAGAFYRRHRRELSGILHPGEIEYVRTSRKPGESFAMIFSAKEAVFKALGASWLGPAGFKDIHLLPKKHFSVRLSGPLKRDHARVLPLEVTHQRDRTRVIATCHSPGKNVCAGT